MDHLSGFYLKVYGARMLHIFYFEVKSFKKKQQNEGSRSRKNEMLSDSEDSAFSCMDLAPSYQVAKISKG